MLYTKNMVVVDDMKALLERMKPTMFLKEKSKMLHKTKMGCRQDPSDSRDYKFKTVSPSIMEAIQSLPNLIDHTENMSPVKNQGRLGSCVSFAVAAMKEFQEKKEHEEEIKKGKPGRKKEYNYSEAWIYWNCKKIDLWPDEEGTSIRYAMKVLNTIGVPTEKAWPYADIGDIGKPESWAHMVAKWGLIKSYWRVETLTELKLALVDGPVAIGVPCFEEFFSVATDGVIPYPRNPDNIYGGHAICAVGFDNNRQLVKFKNSWGKSWGQNGYGYLPYKYVEDFLWDAWVCKDLEVTKEMLKKS